MPYFDSPRLSFLKSIIIFSCDKRSIGRSDLMMTKFEKPYLRVKGVKIDTLIFLFAVLNDKSNGPRSIFLTPKFTVVNVLEVEK